MGKKKQNHFSGKCAQEWTHGINTRTAQSNTAPSATVFTYARGAGHPAGKAGQVSDYSLFCNNDTTCKILEFSHASYQILVAPQ